MGRAGLEMAPRMWARYKEDCKTPVDPPAFHPAPSKWPDTGVHAAWLGHSTVLLKIDGTVLITDPVFSRRVGINIGPLTVGLKRLVAPALSYKELPPVDVVLLSHAHMDHLDLPSLRSLENSRTRVVTASKTKDLLRVRRFAGVDELRWGESARVAGLEVRAFEVRHWGARMQTDHFRGYNGYLIDSPNHRILFGGDTAFTHAFRGLRSSRRIDLAIMPIGAYDPWISSHCNPEQAVRMANDAGADLILPVHHQTFRLSREPRLEPIERLVNAASPERVALKAIGQEFHLGRPHPVR